MSPELIGVLGIIVLLVLFFLEFSIGLSLFIVGFVGVALLSDWSVGLSQLGTMPFSTSNNYGLSVIPLFVLMGLLMSNTGLGKDLFIAVDKWMGNLRGGLAMATIGASSIFAAISGSTTATTATLSKIAIPEMDQYNYKRSLSTASVAAGGTLGILIPPSVILILYGTLTAEPIGALLIAGIVPGVLMAIVFMLTIYIQVLLKPDLAPRRLEVYPFKEKIGSLKRIWPFLVVFFMSIGGIYFGVFTPSEAGGIGAFGAFIVSLLMKRLSFKQLMESCHETLMITVMIFLILIGAGLFNKFLALSQIPMNLANTVKSLDVSPIVILSLILLVYLILGMFMDGLAILVLTLPIVYPMIIDLGYSGIWFGVIIVMIINIGFLTPPLGVSVYIISGVIKDMPIEKIFKGVLPMVLTMIVFTIILCIFPEVVTFLPDMIKD